MAEAIDFIHLLGKLAPLEGRPIGVDRPSSSHFPRMRPAEKLAICGLSNAVHSPR